MLGPAPFQASLEQCEQFVRAAQDADYATRPLQLFYAMSQGTRAAVAASPRVGQDWRVHGHGLSALTEPTELPDVEVFANGNGLFQYMARVLDFSPLVQEERIRLGDLWPLIPESIEAPLEGNGEPSAIMFWPGVWSQHHTLYGAELHWIRQDVVSRYGQDKEALARQFAQYPALKGLPWTASLNVPWQVGKSTVSLAIHFDLTDGQRPDVIKPGSRLGARYGVQVGDERFIAPAVGSMSGPMHPVLAWWAVLLGLSSLARYEPAGWAKMIDVNSSPYATAVEHLLDDAVLRIPGMLLNILTNVDDPG
ncbi:YaaC family protein [Actinoplanes sp. NPDC051513]|uniref:YaaC family protein n=1 Tax=Actinoplanes sp. NPDC051513 TaxID=3363908 RepID=UPI00378C6A6B